MFKTLCCVALLSLPLTAMSTTLTMETWRVDDQALWQQTLLPLLHKTAPDLDVKLNPVKTSEYDATLQQRLENKTAGDLIICRPYDQSLALFKAGHLVDLTDFPGMENFPSFAKSAWQTDTGAATFCLPIASVILARLEKQMPLQIDATVQYALGRQKEELTIADTKIDSPYNTYERQGLPPGPISSPGMDAVRAVLDAAPGEYLYYVAEKDGRHVFTKTLEEHQAEIDRIYGTDD